MTEKIIHSTNSLCSVCKTSLPADIVRTADQQVVMKKSCKIHGRQDVVISPNADWYEETLQSKAELTPVTESKAVSQGCPFDCGPCKSHQQQIQLPIIPITSSCNLDCPICYTHNKNSAPYQMSENELRAILQHLRKAAPEKRIVNITGGEPTQHPQFERLIELCHEEGVHRITISTHGLRFIKEESLLEKLAKLEARVVLSFDSFKDTVNQEMLGGRLTQSKMKVLELLGKYNVATTLLPVLAKGQNDDELGDFLKLAFKQDFIRSVEFHTMTFTGQNGSHFAKKARYSTYEVLTDIESQTRGWLKKSDFVPSPAAHPLCYSVTYMLRLKNNDWIPFPRIMSRTELRELLTGSLYLEPTPQLEKKFAQIIDELWSGARECENSELVLASLKHLMSQVFSVSSEIERLKVAETFTKAVYIHSHMDDDTFDTERVRQCPVGIREADGSNTPSCSYNVLYRSRDHRFTPQPEAPISTLGPGDFFNGKDSHANREVAP